MVIDSLRELGRRIGESCSTVRATAAYLEAFIEATKAWRGITDSGPPTTLLEELMKTYLYNRPPSHPVHCCCYGLAVSSSRDRLLPAPSS